MERLLSREHANKGGHAVLVQTPAQGDEIFRRGHRSNILGQTVRVGGRGVTHTHTHTHTHSDTHRLMHTAGRQTHWVFMVVQQMM